MIDNNEPLRIKRKGEDGYRLISVRIREDILDALDKMAADTHYSRNELINMILDNQFTDKNLAAGQLIRQLFSLFNTAA